ncbi:fungal-specific transcription factor domain-containing protein [Aspergillus terricola var. indicus]
MQSKRQRNSYTSQGQGPFKCEVCGKSFSRIENLVRHAENPSLSTLDKPRARFSCGVCAKRFTRSDILKRHLRLHRPTGDQQNGTSTTSPLQWPAAEHTRTEIQPHQAQHSEGPIHGLGVQAPYAEDYAPRADHVCAAMTPSEGHDSPMGYSSLWDRAYGVYGEGSFDADLAWILEMAPPDCMTASMLATDDPSQPNPLPIATAIPSRDGDMGPGNGGYSASFGDGNSWPDVDGLPNPPGARDAPGLVVPASDWWVDAHEISSSTQAGEERARHLTVDVAVRARLLASLQQESSAKNGLLAPEETQFPSVEILEHFLRLFFEHVHPRFPAIHRPTFATATAPPFLLLAMMLLGSSHSTSNRANFGAVYLRPVVVMFSRMQALDTAFLRETDNILTLLFLCVSAAWSGHKFAFEFAEGARGILVTACRRCRLLDCRLKPSPDAETSPSMRARLHQSWQSWIRTEQRKRLALSIYANQLFDLQFPALFLNQPYISKAETVNLLLPCHETFWEAPSAAAWKVLLGPAAIPPSTYFMVPLDTCLLYPATKREPPYAPIDSFGKTMLMYALFTHIFEWRQSLNIVLHSAFIRGPEGTGPGEGLMEREKWLRDGLAAWLDSYHRDQNSQTGPAPDAALLLHYLAGVHLDINVSDLHLFAGRSGLSEDIDLAENSLRRWCVSPDSARTMLNVYQMLEIAYRIIKGSREHQCGFEIAAALFTGGLMCWMYAKLGGQGPPTAPVASQINQASNALREISCWGICSNFAQILERFVE